MSQNNLVTGEEYLYLQLSDQLEKMIRRGVMKTGDKLLSVRALSTEKGISVSTVFRAYSELEIRGLIEARPKSGYYVKFNPSLKPTPENFSKNPIDNGYFSNEDIINLVYHNFTKENVVRFSLSSPDKQLMPIVKLNKAMGEALRKSSHSCINYEETQGNLLLRKQIAKYSFNWGSAITENEVITTQGCMEAIMFCLKVTTEPGDLVAIECPTYFGILNAIKILGLRAIEIPTHELTGVDLDFLEHTIHQNPIKVCLFITNFNNPLGSCMPDAQKQRLVNLLAVKDIPLIEDDINGDLYFGKTRPKTCKSFDTKGLVLLCSSISKCLAPGYRVGWCIPGRYKDRILSLKLTYNISSSNPTQAAIGIFFQTGRFDLHMRNLRKTLESQCLCYIQAINEYFPEFIEVIKPQGGNVLWIRLNRGINTFELFQTAMKFDISIAPGHLFSLDNKFSNYVRLSFASPFNKEIGRSLKILGILIKQFADLSQN